MGAWGHGIGENDTTADIIEDFEELLKKGVDLRKAAKQTLGNPLWADILDDPEQAALVWLGLAQVQWKYGDVPASTLKRIRADFAAGHGLDNWTEPLKRRKAVQAFITKLAQPNPKPKALPKPRPDAVRKRRYKPAGYQAGDCLSVKLLAGGYGAAYVVDSRSPDDDHGSNVVVELDYLSDRPPTMADFPKMKPLKYPGGYSKGELCLFVSPHRNKESDSLADVVGNRRIKYPGYKVEFMRNVWVDRLKKPDPFLLKILKSDRQGVDMSDASLRAVAYIDWDLGGRTVEYAKRRKK